MLLLLLLLLLQRNRLLRNLVCALLCLLPFLLQLKQRFDFLNIVLSLIAHVTHVTHATRVHLGISPQFIHFLCGQNA